MTNAELEELLQNCPTLYHMAELGSWPSVQQHGLLSTSALLDMYGVNGDERLDIESRHRPESVTIRAAGLADAVVRDQKPMSDSGLRRALNGSMSTAEWYRILNQRVFFWLTRERLLRLTNAGAYRDREHDVLELDARSLVYDYYGRITLSPINSGCTTPFPHPRDGQTFTSIDNYPYHEKRRVRRRTDVVVELCVDSGVPDVARYVTRVVRMRSDQELQVIFATQ